MSQADIGLLDLVGMGLRNVRPEVIVKAKVMAKQAGVDINRKTGLRTTDLEAHYLAGGDVMRVINAIIAAQRANIDLDFDRAAAIDLAGRDVMDAVKTSVYPKVIDCPDPQRSGKNFLSAISKEGVELKIRARVTVRTNLEQLIGGATEETIIARVGESIISSIGSSENHQNVLENPDRISREPCLSVDWMLTRHLKLSPLISPISTLGKTLVLDCKPIKPRPTHVLPAPVQKSVAPTRLLTNRK